ncbi:MAG: hypothetical protein ACFB50_15645 [Rubrobacteraceae bacterium]
MPGRKLSEQNTEYRFTGTFSPTGLSHPLLGRHGESCEVIGYDLNLDRRVPLTFLIRLTDGLETHVLPTHVDDDPGKPGSWSHDTDLPAHLRGGYYQRSYMYLRAIVIESRILQYRELIFGDRFDGTPSSDHYKGREDAFRTFAKAFGLKMPDEAATQRAALSHLKGEYPSLPAVEDFIQTVESGEQWEGRG